MCGGNFTAEVISQNFSTPLFSQPYPNELDCEWNIKTSSKDKSILVVFFEIDTERDDDIIQVRPRYFFDVSGSEF